MYIQQTICYNVTILVLQVCKLSKVRELVNFPYKFEINEL